MKKEGISPTIIAIIDTSENVRIKNQIAEDLTLLPSSKLGANFK